MSDDNVIDLAATPERAVAALLAAAEAGYRSVPPELVIRFHGALEVMMSHVFAWNGTTFRHLAEYALAAGDADSARHLMAVAEDRDALTAALADVTRAGTS